MMGDDTASFANRRILWWYSATVFLSSAILLVLEITAGRLIAPYVGVTIYSWTSIIGVILAGLSLGNWVGGVLADRGAGEPTVGVTLALAGVFSLLSLWILTLIAPTLQNSGLNLISASFLYVLGMFFVPALLLGVPAPLLTTLALNLDRRTGRVVGRLHALAAFGSIVGTFVTGFILIQYLGSTHIVVACGALLIVLSVPFYRNAQRVVPLALVLATGLVAGLTHQRQGFTNPCEYESAYFCIRVVDASADAPFGEARALVLDHLLHGINHREDAELLIAPYVHLMQELVVRHLSPDDDNPLFFFAGGGSYTQPRAARSRYPKATIVVAELDPLVTQVVRERLFFQTADIDIRHGDARVELTQAQKDNYNEIDTDAFHDIAIPYHLVTREFAELVKSRLLPDGFYATNVVDAFPDPRMVKSLIKTLKTTFRHVDVWVDEVPNQVQRMTYVIAASDQAWAGPDRLIAAQGIPRQWFRITEPLQRTGTRSEDLPVFSDDYVPVERLISDLLFSAKGL
ncbi:MAG: fused MFS/spermidine synthase [Pseudomonadota bacterium]